MEALKEATDGNFGKKQQSEALKEATDGSFEKKQQMETLKRSNRWKLWKEATDGSFEIKKRPFEAVRKELRKIQIRRFNKQNKQTNKPIRL